MEDTHYFNNNEGIGGFEQGGYDINAIHPTDTNWTRLSRYSIPTEPKLLWKVSTRDVFIDQIDTDGAFVIDRNKNIIISDCDNNIVGKNQGRLMQVSENGEVKELFRTNFRLKSPVIGKDGMIYLTTQGAMDSVGHILYCLFPDGSIHWEYPIFDGVTSKPVFDEAGNVYIFAYNKRVGTLFSIDSNGILNWNYQFNSVNWYEPVISKKGILLVGLNVDQTLCAFNKCGQKLWEKKLGQGIGSSTPIIKNDGTIYVCLSGALYALDEHGNIIWKYKPSEVNVFSSPAIDINGNLYFSISQNRLVSLDPFGNERWIKELKGTTYLPTIIGKGNNVCQPSFMQRYPQYVSWIEIFAENGEKIWEYELNGTIISTVIGEDNLMYVLANCHTHKKRGWKDKMDVKWDLYAIGQK